MVCIGSTFADWVYQKFQLSWDQIFRSVVKGGQRWIKTLQKTRCQIDNPAIIACERQNKEGSVAVPKPCLTTSQCQILPGEI